MAEIPDAEVIHGVAAAPDGSRLYLTNESTDTLDIADVKTLKIRKKIPLTAAGRPEQPLDSQGRHAASMSRSRALRAAST